MARDRREAVSNTSVKTQVKLAKHDESSSFDTTIAPQSTADLSVQNLNWSASLLNESAEPSNAHPPVIVIDHPILRTVEEVIAQSVSAVDTPILEQSVNVQSLFLSHQTSTTSDRRKETLPRQETTEKGKMSTPRKLKSQSAYSTGESSPTSSGKPREQQLSCNCNERTSNVIGNIEAMEKGIDVNPEPSTSKAENGVDNAMSQPCSNQPTVFNGRRSRKKSSTRYSLAVPLISFSTKLSTPKVTIKVSGERKSSEPGDFRDPDLAGTTKGKLANLMKRRKPMGNDSIDFDSAPTSFKQLVSKRTTGKRKLDTVLSKTGDKPVWTWHGKSFRKTVYSETEKVNVERSCYHAVKHFEGETIKIGDCVLLRAAKGQKPHVGKTAAFWDNELGGMMMTVFWYWRPEEVERIIRPTHGEMEIYVSNLRDENHVGCIDEKCYVLSALQYANFMGRQKERDMLYRRPKKPVIPLVKSMMFAELPDDDTDPDIVYYTDRGFDGKQKRFWGYHFRGNKLRKYSMDNL